MSDDTTTPTESEIRAYLEAGGGTWDNAEVAALLRVIDLLRIDRNNLAGTLAWIREHVGAREGQSTENAVSHAVREGANGFPARVATSDAYAGLDPLWHRRKVMRIETGPMRFAGDWTGVFLRGDDAMGLGDLLRRFLDRHVAASGVDPATAGELVRLGELADLLVSCHETKGVTGNGR